MIGRVLRRSQIWKQSALYVCEDEDVSILMTIRPLLFAFVLVLVGSGIVPSMRHVEGLRIVE